MPYKRSGRAGGKSVSMIGMLVLLLAALLVLPSCFDDDTETVTMTQTQCDDGTIAAPGDTCDPVDPMSDYDAVREGTAADDRHMDGDRDGMVAGGEDDDYVDGEGGNDTIKGNGGNDDILGGPGDDTLYGGPDDDVLDGQAGDDTLYGDAGNDELIGGTGDNTLYGGDDEDIVIYLRAMRAVVNLNDGTAKVQHATPEDTDPLLGGVDSGIGDDTLTGIENVKGTHGNDIITGDGNANLLKGLDGADTINGLGGDDTIIPNRPMVVEGETPDDGADVVDGGADSDTISYEGEAAANGVTIDLSMVVDAVEADPDNNVVAVIAHVLAEVVGGENDMITVVDEGTKDEPNVVSTIENITGGAGQDDLTGDARANTLNGGGGGDMLDGGDGIDELNGGAGIDTLDGGDGDDMLNGGDDNDTLNGGDDNDTLNGGAGQDTLNGGAGDDTYVAVEGGNNADIVTEDEDEGTDTVHYTAPADDDSTMDDESMDGVTATTPNNVEVVTGTQNADTLTAATAGATILGREGNDTLVGGAGVDVLVGCVGENTLTGGDEDDVFGVFNDGTNADTITDFTTGDEIHLKGFADGAMVTIGKILGNSTHAAVRVDDIPVAVVLSIFAEVPDEDDTMDVDESRTPVEALIDALGGDNAAGDAVTRTVEFDEAKCSN